MSLKRNTFWNLAGTGLPLLLGALTIPYLIKNAGLEAFGILTLIWALIGYFSLFDFGLGRALTQQVAAARLVGHVTELPSLVKTGLWFTAATGALGGIILAAFSDQLAFDWLKIRPSLQSDASQALLIAALGIPLTTVTTGLRGVLEAYEDFKAVNLMRICLGAANFCLPALSVMFVNNSLALMVTSLVVARAIVMIAHLCLVHQKLPSSWISSRFDKSNLKSLVAFGAWMTVTNVIGPLMVTADRFVISSVLGASLVAYYTVPFEALIRVLVLPSALTSALFPRLATLMVTNVNAARLLYKKCLVTTILALLPVCIMIAAGAKFGLTLWLGSDFAEQSWLLVCIMAVGVLFNGVASVPFAAIQAAGDARSTAILHISELLIYIPLLFVGITMHGLVGAAMAWSARTGIDLIALLIIYNKKFSEKE